MKSKRYKIGLFSPDGQLVDYVRKVVAGRPIDLQVSAFVLEEAIPAAKQMETNGIEAILCGEGTGSILREHVQAPVITFSRNSADFIRGLTEAAKIGRKVLIPLYRDKIEFAASLEQFFNIEISQLTYYDAASLRGEISRLSSRDFDVIVGGGFGVACARERGLKVVEVGRSERDVESSIETAISIVQANRDEREKAERFRCIIDSTSDGIIASDHHGVITTVNQVAAQMLGTPAEDLLGRPVDAFISTKAIHRVLSSQKPIYDSLEKAGRQTIVCNHHPFLVDGAVAGCVSTLEKISNVIRSENRIRRTLSKGHTAKYSLHDLVYRSDCMKQVVERAAQYARTSSNLLITGETGTGKEILVQGIHNLSARKRNPFVSLNCAALPDHLLESELFGYEEGAFTGTRKGGKAGLFELAHRGTIFLDEIGETPESVQIRLLRVIQEKEIMRLGGDQLVPIDVRVVAASNRDLRLEVGKGHFREDLYFRLNVLRIHIPPLRERLADIPLLIHSFIDKFSAEHHLKRIEIPAACVKKLMDYQWSGNVRQLKNFAERMVLMSQSEFNVGVFDEILSELIEFGPVDDAPLPRKSSGPAPGGSIQKEKEAYDIERIRKALLETGYSKSKAARKLGISRTTLWKRLKNANLAG